MRRLGMAILALALITPSLAFADHHEEGAEVQESTATAGHVHSVNPDIFGLFNGSYRFNYVYLMDGTHGFMIEPSLYSSTSGSESYTSYGATAGYRWHWSGEQDSGFLGVNVGYASGTGVSTQEGEDFDLTVTQFSLVPNIGKRWAWDFGLNITLRFGIGYGDYGASTESDDPLAQEGVKALDSLLNLFPIAFDGELSVGWCF